MVRDGEMSTLPAQASCGAAGTRGRPGEPLAMGMLGNPGTPINTNQHLAICLGRRAALAASRGSTRWPQKKSPGLPKQTRAWVDVQPHAGQ